jgi:hypothetical protein
MNATNRVTEYVGMLADQMTVHQAADRLAVPPEWVYGWIKQGGFRTVYEADYFYPLRLREDEVEQLRYFGRVWGAQPVRRPR